MMFKTDNKMRAGLSALALMIGAAMPAAAFAQDASNAPADGASDPNQPRLGWYRYTRYDSFKRELVGG